MMADALLLLRSAIAANSTPTLTTSAEPTADSSQTTTDLAQATHIQFNHTSKRDVLPLATATRFQQEDKPVDLRSVFFAWQTKDLTVPEYLSGLQTIRDALQAAGKDSAVQQLVFAEKIDLITWLDSLSDESEHIRPLNEEEQAKQAHLAAQVARGPVSAPAVDAAGVGRGHLDPRLREILNGERRTGDRNSVLRGVKPTVGASLPVRQQKLTESDRTFRMFASTARQSFSVAGPSQARQPVASLLQRQELQRQQARQASAKATVVWSRSFYCHLRRLRSCA